MKKVAFLILIQLVLFLNLSFSGEIVDRILAVVEDEIILQSDVEMMAQMYAVQLKINPETNPEKYNEIRKLILDQLIEQNVLFTKAIEDSVEVSEEEVEIVMNRQIVDLFGSEEEAVKKVGMPLRKLKELYREDVRKKSLIERYRQQLAEKVKISGEEMEEFYKTYKDSLPEVPDRYLILQIVKTEAPGGNSREIAKRKAEMLLQKIKDGADFYEIAKEYSDDEKSAARGGMLGFIRRGDLLKSFEDVVFSVDEGEVSDVIETPLGFHIVKIAEKKDDMVNPQHILIKIVPGEDEDEKIIGFLKGIKKRAESGESFEELAKEYSDDPDAENTGGRIPWIYLEGIQTEIEEFKNVLPNLKVGEIGEPFKSKLGYHLVLLENKVEKHEMTIERDRELIERYAKGKKSTEEFVKFVKKAKEEIYIEIKEPLP